MVEGNNPRHCMVVYSYYPLGETRVQRQAEALVRAGYEVDVICPRMPGEKWSESHSGVEIRRIPVSVLKSSLYAQFLGYLLFFFGAGLLLTVLHLRRRYRTVQVHNLPDFLVFCAAVPKLTGAKVILDLHDLMPEFLSSKFSGEPPDWLRRAVLIQERWACRFADHVITVSEHWRQTLSERSAEAAKTSVVMNLADETVFLRPDLERVHEAGSMSLIYHGTVVYRYGLDLVIEAISNLGEKTPELTLDVIGQGDQFQALSDQVEQLGLVQRVRLREGLVPAEELPGIITSADVGIVPYRNDVFTDGLIPTKLLEYAAMGLPVIASRTSAIEELVGDSFVQYFEPGDVDDLAGQLLLLYEEPLRRENLARETVAFNLRANWSTHSGEYVNLVKSLAL